jgi:PSP1 C-terminal conserved region
VGEHSYLVRYGLMANVARFHAGPDLDDQVFERDDLVVIVTQRGLEIGEILTRQEGCGKSQRGGDSSREPFATTNAVGRLEDARIVRRATPDDLQLAERAEASRQTWFGDCQRILEEAGWPGELIDVEPLLDGGTLVLHHAAFEAYDEGVLRARFRVMRDVEVVMESIGSDPIEEAEAAGSCGSCSSGGCSTGGGCSSGGCSSKSAEPSTGRKAVKAAGCATCAIGKKS